MPPVASAHYLVAEHWVHTFENAAKRMTRWVYGLGEKKGLLVAQVKKGDAWAILDEAEMEDLEMSLEDEDVSRQYSTVWAGSIELEVTPPTWAAKQLAKARQAALA